MKGGARVVDTVLLLAAVVVAWEGANLYTGSSAIASPWETLVYGAEFIQRPSFWGHAGATLAAFGWSVVLSIVIGVVAGLVLGFRRFAGDVAEPMLVSFYALPKITLYPLVLLVFGLGVSAKIAFGVLHGVVPVILFTLGAIKSVKPVLIRTARVMRLTPFDTMTRVLAPSIARELMTGVRAGFSLTLLGVLIGEMFASQQGLGFLIVNGLNQHNVAMTTFVIVFVVALALVANGVLGMLVRGRGGR